MSGGEWFYEVEGARQGPVSERHLGELVELGVVRGSTLVWTAGMDGWRTYAEAAPAIEHPDPAPAGESDLETCAYSGKRLPRSRMLPFGEEWVASEHRQEFIQQLAEGRDEREDPLPGYPFAPHWNLYSLASQTWQVWSAQWWLIMAFAAVIWIPFDFLIEYIASDEENGRSSSTLLQNLSNFFVGCFVNAGVLAYGMSRWKGGGSWSLGKFFRAAGGGYGSILLTRFLFALLIIPIFIPIGFIAVTGNSVALAVVLGIAALIAVIFVVTRLTSAEPFALILNQGGGAALKQSWEHTKGRFWRLFLYRVAFYFPVAVISGGMFALTALPGLDHFVIRGAMAVATSCFSTLFVLFEMILALHLQANPVPPNTETPAIPPSDVVPPHDPVA
jgi:hypothetical protein